MAASSRDARSQVPWAELTVKEVLRLQGQIIEELRDRKVIRTRNVVGELAETIVARAYGGKLGPPSQTAWDVQVDDRRLQVKCRVVEDGEKRTQQFTPFMVNEEAVEEADAFVFVALNAESYEVRWALEIAREDVVAMSRSVPRSAKRRVDVRQVRACATSVDVTALVVDAYAALDLRRE